MAWVITSPCCCGGTGAWGCCGSLLCRGGLGVRGGLWSDDPPEDVGGPPPAALPVGRGGVYPPTPGGVGGAGTAEGSSWDVVCAGGAPNVPP